MSRAAQFIKYFENVFNNSQISQDDYDYRYRQYKDIRAQESEKVMNGEMINVSEGEAVISNQKILQSSGFKNCNCFVLRNLDTGDALMMHVHYHNDLTLGPKPYGIPGISGAICEPLNNFLDKEGRKVGVSLYKPFHYNIHQSIKGGGNDYGATEWLETKGVAMKRHALPYFQLSDSIDASEKEDMDPRAFQHFDVIYDPTTNELNIETINPEMEEKVPFISIDRLKLFSHCIRESAQTGNTLMSVRG